MATKRLDIKTRAPDGYFEYSMMRGVEMKTIEDKECLWQEIVGELKTNKGELLGVGQQDYGSNLKQLISEPIDVGLELEIEQEVKKIVESYVGVAKADVNAGEYKRGVITIEIKLYTLYGTMLEVLNMKKGC